MNGMPPPVPKNRRPRRISIGVLVCLFPLGIVAFLLIWHVKWRVGNTRAVSRLERAARAAGEPLNFAELAATYPEIPASSNAYVALEAVWESEDPDFWAAFKAGQRSLPQTRADNDPKDVPFPGVRGPPPSERWSTNSFNAAAKLLASKREHMSKVREALNRPEFRAPIAFEDGQAALLPYLMKMKREATLFWVEAGWAAEAGRRDEALDAIEEIGLVGNCLKNDPFMIGQLVRLSVYVLAMGSAERLLSRETFSEAQLERLAGVISTFQATEGYKRALLGERAMIFGFLDSPKRAFLLSQQPDESETGEAAAEKSTTGMQLMGALGMKSAEKRLMGEAFAQLIRLAENLDYAKNNREEQIFDDLDRQARTFPPKMITALMMPALKNAGEKFAREEALRLCAQTAIRIEQYRLQHGGGAPGKLADLPGSVPTDPFNGEELHYKNTNAGYIVYSVGRDHKDNGGLLEPTTKGPLPHESDVGFRVERVISKPGAQQ